MSDLPAGQERLLKQLISARRCRICRHTFDESQIRMAAKDEKLWFLSARCRTCRHQQLFRVALRGDAQDLPPRDVSDEEAAYFDALEPVGPDEVLDVHLFLLEFDGDFQRLFGA